MSRSGVDEASRGGESHPNLLSDDQDEEEGSRHFMCIDMASINAKLNNRGAPDATKNAAAVSREACEPERAITPISNREVFADAQGVLCTTPLDDENLDNTLDQYIEDLREASKKADICKMQMESLGQCPDASVEFQDMEKEA